MAVEFEVNDGHVHFYDQDELSVIQDIPTPITNETKHMWECDFYDDFAENIAPLLPDNHNVDINKLANSAVSQVEKSFHSDEN